MGILKYEELLNRICLFRMMRIFRYVSSDLRWQTHLKIHDDGLLTCLLVNLPTLLHPLHLQVQLSVTTKYHQDGVQSSSQRSIFPSASKT